MLPATVLRGDLEQWIRQTLPLWRRRTTSKQTDEWNHCRPRLCWKSSLSSTSTPPLLHPTLGTERLTSVDCVSGLPILWWLVGFSQWEAWAWDGRVGGEWVWGIFSPDPPCKVTMLGHSSCQAALLSLQFSLSGFQKQILPLAPSGSRQ